VQTPGQWSVQSGLHTRLQCRLVKVLHSFCPLSLHWRFWRPITALSKCDHYHHHHLQKIIPDNLQCAELSTFPTQCHFSQSDSSTNCRPIPHCVALQFFEARKTREMNATWILPPATTVSIIITSVSYCLICLHVFSSARLYNVMFITNFPVVHASVVCLRVSSYIIWRRIIYQGWHGLGWVGCGHGLRIYFAFGWVIMYHSKLNLELFLT